MAQDVKFSDDQKAENHRLADEWERLYNVTHDDTQAVIVKQANGNVRITIQKVGAANIRRPSDK